MKFYDNQNDDLEPIYTEEERFITVFLANFATGTKRNFRCFNCSKLLCQYESEVVAVIDTGETPKNKSSLEVLCTRCRIKYRFLW
ncbi:MAG: hypothetical protein UV58_C0013G0016 [Candidatus Wolfebacteria bacterium GW2011_GWC1_43_10]|uniref:Uncharacterized protein n=1 Tax=Candidatus Wolfebacteria bacterium GW2011_GWC1_43_10 TaxID=1619011 RepID=A0A0G1F5B4_9BACT|nr:MAG: hypothetical protein UV58_C0013G0016 [Candidatus Wolfebacteria bacterium GW2011_GWC1_43_10]